MVITTHQRQSRTAAHEGAGPRLAIVGGGASAVCLLDALAERGQEPGVVEVFEPSAAVWRGRPFQHDLAAIRVNALPGDMSVRAGDQRHFERWLAACAGGDRRSSGTPCSSGGQCYVPRHVYGRYLEEVAAAAVRRLVERGWAVTIVRDRVVRVDPPTLVDGRSYRVRTEGGTAHLVGDVVLCIGGGAPADGYGLAGHPRVITEPYPLARTLAALGRDTAVGVIGTGLTAVDVTLALAASGHRGPVVMASRSGSMPAVRQRAVEFRLSAFTVSRLGELARRDGGLTLRSLTALMVEELVVAGQRPGAVLAEIDAVAKEEPLQRLRRHLADVNSPDLGLRILQRAVPETGPDVWSLLADADRKVVLRRYHRTLMTLCCPMPPETARVLCRLAEAGMLEITGGLLGVHAERGGFRLRTAAGDRQVDAVVNAANPPRHRIPPGAASLVGSIVENRCGEYHPMGGLTVERATSRLVVAGRPVRGLYALGDLAAGSLLFTFGVPSLVDRAADITADLCGGIDRAGNLRVDPKIPVDSTVTDHLLSI